MRSPTWRVIGIAACGLIVAMCAWLLRSIVEVQADLTANQAALQRWVMDIDEDIERHERLIESLRNG